MIQSIGVIWKVRNLVGQDSRICVPKFFIYVKEQGIPPLSGCLAALRTDGLPEKKKNPDRD